MATSARSPFRATWLHRVPADLDTTATQSPLPLRRRTVEGGHVGISCESIEVGSETSSNKGYVAYVVEGDDPLIPQIIEEDHIVKSMVEGGSGRPTIAHHMDKVIEPKEITSSCGIQGCNGEVLRDHNGDLVLPCECGMKICRDCYDDVLKEGYICPGCKEPYRFELDEAAISAVDRNAPLRSPMSNINHDHVAQIEPYNQAAVSIHVNETWDSSSNRSVSGTPRMESALPPNVPDHDRKENSGHPWPGSDKAVMAWKPLTRKLKVPASVLSPYRLLVVLRFVALGFFLRWRLVNPNRDAIWLWGMSVVCEIWFAFSWLLDQLPKLSPLDRITDLAALKEKFEQKGPNNPTGKCDLPGIDVFVSTADPEKEPPLVTANTILSILAADYPVGKIACYVSDDGGALLTLESLAEAANFAKIWVPFCRKHKIEPRNPESYFSLKGDPYRQKTSEDFVKDRRKVKREYDEYKVRINALPESIRRRSETFNAREEEEYDGEDFDTAVKKRATWMADGTHWAGTWIWPRPDHSRGDHAAIVKVLVKPPAEEPLFGTDDDELPLDFEEVDVRLPLLVYLSREKRPGYDHNKKAGAMNALVRASAIISNGPFILNLDCDHYVYNAQALREGLCFMMDKGGEKISFVQFPQRFEGIDPSDRYGNHNTVFFDGNMRALDGLQGPVYVGTGCMFRRIALYGFDPPHRKDRSGCWCFPCFQRPVSLAEVSEEELALSMADGSGDHDLKIEGVNPKRFGNSKALIDSVPIAEYQGRPLADHPSIRNGRRPGALLISRRVVDASKVTEAVTVISCWFEDRTEWGKRVGWIYGSITEDVVTGYRMHNRGWRSVYCVTKRDAFRGSAPINLTDRLIQVLRWATGSVEILFSPNNPLLSSSKMKFLQKIAYLNVCIYPFTSIFLIVYCFLPALCLFSGQFITQTLSIAFLVYLLAITTTLCLLALLEIKWSKITLEEWWRNEQFWLIGGTSAHLAAVFQGILKVVAGVEISFTLTTKSGGDDNDDEFAELYAVKWTSLMIPPIAILMTNLIAICVGISRTIYSVYPQWSRLIGGVFFSFWVLAHLYPFAKGLMGRPGRIPTIVFIWSGLTAITISLLWISISPPSQSKGPSNGEFQFP